MPTNLATFRIRVREKIPNISTVELGDTEIDANLQQALREYSKNRPHVKVDDKQADGGFDYALPSDWINDFSVFTFVEFPVDSQEPAPIQLEKILIYRTPTTRVMRFTETTPSSGTIRRTYTTTHVVDANSSTVLANDFDAVASLAAARSCFDLSRRFSQDSSSLIAADAVDRRDKAKKYSDAGAGLLKEFAVHIGIEVSRVVAAVGIKDLDLGFSFDQDFLTHPAIRR